MYAYKVLLEYVDYVLKLSVDVLAKFQSQFMKPYSFYN